MRFISNQTSTSKCRFKWTNDDKRNTIHTEQIKTKQNTTKPPFCFNRSLLLSAQRTNTRRKSYRNKIELDKYVNNVFCCYFFYFHHNSFISVWSEPLTHPTLMQNLWTENITFFIQIMGRRTWLEVNLYNS